MKRKRIRNPPAYTTRCETCVRLKTKCTGQFPCSQCFAICQQCLPVQGSVKSGTPYIDLALSRLDPRTLAEPMIQAFFSLRSRACVNSDDATLVLRMWRMMSLHAGADVTHGMFDVSIKNLGIHPLQLESQADLSLDRTASVMLADLEARRRRAVQEIQQSRTFQALDDGRSMLMVMHLSPDMGMTLTVNRVAARLFASAEEVNSYIHKEKVIFSYLIASLISPEDRQEWFETQMATVCAMPCRPTSLIKFCNREGKIDLYIMRYRRMTFPEFPGQNFRVVTLERAPNSRHITERPSRRYRIVDGFRRGRNTDEEQVAPVGALPPTGEEVWAATVPAMACLPLPPPDGDEKPVEGLARFPKLPTLQRQLQPPPPPPPPPPPLPPPLAGLECVWPACPPPLVAQYSTPPWVKEEEPEEPPLPMFNPEDEKLLQELLFEGDPGLGEVLGVPAM